MREGDGPPSPFFIPSHERSSGDDMCILETERLILRPPGPSDIASITAWLGDYDVARMTSRAPHPYAEEDAEEFVAAGAPNRFVITRKADGLFMGLAGLHAEDGHEF